ncbi:LCP family protein [Streptomyces sp. NPDC050738]|uniref:LCP family protein n=1 Tax=Streptomyces sp. NPDC050738 TaxID=3154744 RepID=UPI00342CCD3B
MYADGGQPPAEPGEGSGHRRGGPRRRAKRGKHRILKWVAAVVSLLILGTAGAGYAYYRHLNANIKKDALNLGESKAPKAKANAAGQTPMNILLIGSDARDTKENQKLGGAKNTFGGLPLADVQMLLHVSADRSNMSVVSMPRDTLVKIPKCTDKKGKVYSASTEPHLTNESLGRGGPGCTVATWESITNIHIDHFMMIDFSGVVSMADAIGGVPVCVDANVRSRDRNGHGSGLELTKGDHNIKGIQALQWLRTRYGFVDGTDLARAEAQHQYMSSMVRQLRKGTKLSDPGQLMDLAEAATNALTVDDGLGTVKKLYDLGEDLKKVPTKRISMTTMPNMYSQDPNHKGKVVPIPGDAEKLWSMVRDDVPLDGKPAAKKKVEQVSKDPAAPVADTGVLVHNGTGTDSQAPAEGRATAVASVLKAAGYARAKSDHTLKPQAKTVINFPSADLEGDAQALAKALGIPLSSVKKSTDVSGVTLTVGADWRTGDAYPKADDKTPSTAKVLNGEKVSCMHVQPGYSF